MAFVFWAEQEQHGTLQKLLFLTSNILHKMLGQKMCKSVKDPFNNHFKVVRPNA